MAKKEVTPSMVDQFAEFKNNKHIDKATMVSVLEDSFRSVLTKMLSPDVKLNIILNADNGDVQILQNLTIVPNGEVENPHTQISLDDAHSNGDPDAEVGEDFTKEIVFADFGRRAILNLRQTLQSKILDLQKKLSMLNSKNLKVNSYRARYIKHGQKKFSFLTMTKTSSCFQSQNQSMAISSAKAKL